MHSKPVEDLNELLNNLDPHLSPQNYAFCKLQPFELQQAMSLNIFAIIKEDEGWTLIAPQSVAESRQWKIQSLFKKITLRVHSSLEAVGLTAAVSTALARIDCSANVVAANHHDHIFVPVDKHEQAMKALLNLKSFAMK